MLFRSVVKENDHLIHRQSSLNVNRDIRKKITKQTTESKFKSTNNTSNGRPAQIINFFERDFASQIAKQNIDLLDKLRNISRVAYSIGSMYNITSIFCFIVDINKMKKLIGDIYEILNPNHSSKSINENATKLANILEDKLRVI